MFIGKTRNTVAAAFALCVGMFFLTCFDGVGYAGDMFSPAAYDNASGVATVDEEENT